MSGHAAVELVCSGGRRERHASQPARWHVDVYVQRIDRERVPKEVMVRNGNSKGTKDPNVPFMFGAGVGAKVFFVPTSIANSAGTEKAMAFDVI